MNIDTVKIGGICYQVEEVKGLKNETNELNGEIDYNECKIRLSAGQLPQFRRVAIWHEVLHGIAFQAGLGLEEHQIIAISYGVAQVIADNPALTMLQAQTDRENGYVGSPKVESVGTWTTS